jgi:putative SOS response-associated peptidase YedK
MCYSAQIWADYRRYIRAFGAELDIEEFYELFWRRTIDPKVKIPKAMDTAFAEPRTDAELKIKSAIDTFAAAETVKLEQGVFEQRKRLADAERTLQTKPTKAAANNQRIATDKIAWAMGKLTDLKRVELTDLDSRIFPGHYAPVMVMENGRRVVRPMRYQCRPSGKPAFYDTKFPGTYNARRDNLEGFWKELFGYSHGIVVVNAFFENVNEHRAEGRELREGEDVKNLILEFRPRPTQDMLVACLWSRWTSPGEPDLLSFAAITDDPPPEVSAAGHDRCIIPIRPENIDAWLNPDPRNLAAQYAILDDRERPYYEHRLAA